MRAASASFMLIDRGSASLARFALLASRFAIRESDAIATAIISLPSSVVPMEYTRTRGVALASIRMYVYTSFEYGRLLRAPAMSPNTAFGVGTVVDAGR